MSLATWLATLESPSHNHIELGLSRIKAVAEHCHIANKFNCPVITVAGTNGKGSSVACLESVYKAAGYQVGSYTSPHLFKFNERIKINLQPIEDNNIIEAFEQIKSAQSDIHLTYFEYSTLAAFILFEQAQLDVIILEIGMGGQQDCCNIIDPDVALITSISLDHMEYLGDTREKIALEKAGIMRPNIPVICSDPNPPVTLKEQAEKIGAHLLLIDPNEKFSNSTIHSNNLAGCRKVIEMLQTQLPVSEQITQGVFVNLVVPGRHQCEEYDCHWVFDVSHNVGSIEFLAQFLRSEKAYKKTIAIVGMMGDKQIEESLAAISDLIDFWHVIPLESPRAASPEKLRDVITKISNKPVEAHLDVDLGLSSVNRQITDQDRVVVFGSFLTVEAIHLRLSPCGRGRA